MKGVGGVWESSLRIVHFLTLPRHFEQYALSGQEHFEVMYNLIADI